MLGAIIGDIVGSVYEWNNIKTKDFPFFSTKCHFTDDTVMTLAVSDACVEYQLMKNDKDRSWPQHWSRMWFQSRLIMAMKRLGSLYPDAGYGSRFKGWLDAKDPSPYNSFGNGSAMRVSPVAYFSESLEEALDLAKCSAEISHNHPDGIKGAKAVAGCVYLALHGEGKKGIKAFVEENYYPIDFTLDEIRPFYEFDVSCKGTVPVAIEAFLEGTDFTDSIRNAISVGGDSDTIACITGGIAEAYYKDIDAGAVKRALECLDNELLSTYRRGLEYRPFGY